jgi:ATP-dependent DNA ligase
VAQGFEWVVAKRLTSRYVPNGRGTAWRKIKQTMELPCAVIGYRSGRDGLRDLLLAAMVDGKPAYVGTVELGIRGGADLGREKRKRFDRRPETNLVESLCRTGLTARGAPDFLPEL